LAVGWQEHGDETCRAEVTGGEACGVEQDADLSASAADECGFGDEGDLFEFVIDLGDELAEGEVIARLAVEGEGEDGYVVDGSGFDERERDAVGDAIEVGL
jgi:hypothetical protein